MGPCEVCRRKVSWQREFSQTFVWNTAMYKEGQSLLPSDELWYLGLARIWM